MIGVNTNSSDPKKLKTVMDKEKLNWRSFGSREVTVKWNASTPGYYVLDHNGVIRHKWMGNTGPGEKAIDAALEKLIHEAEASIRKEKTKGATEAPPRLPKEIVDAWKTAGAKVGWLRTTHGTWGGLCAHVPFLRFRGAASGNLLILLEQSGS